MTTTQVATFAIFALIILIFAVAAIVGGGQDRARALKAVGILASWLALCVFLAALSGCGDEYEQDAAQLDQPTIQTVTVPAPAAEASETGMLTSDEKRMVDEAIPAARQFLRGYLAYQYGEGLALRIRHATMELRRQLKANSPRVPAEVRRAARWSVRRVEPSGFLNDRVILLATVRDGRTTYPVSLTLVERNGRWIVTEVR